MRIIQTNLIHMINGLLFVMQWEVQNHKPTMITKAVYCIGYLKSVAKQN